jgi:hypothetical protein
MRLILENRFIIPIFPPHPLPTYLPPHRHQHRHPHNLMTLEDFLHSIQTDASPPANLSEAAHALWFAKKGQWGQAHNIAQDMPSDLGSWIHALLHLIEGDVNNAHYWFHRAKQKPVGSKEIDQEWERIARVALSQ